MEEKKQEIFDDLVNFSIAKDEADAYFTDKLKNYLNKRRIIVQFILDTDDNEEEKKAEYMKVLHNINAEIKQLLQLA